MSEMSAGDVAFLLHQLSVDDYFDDDTFDAVVNDDSSRCEINIQDLAESAAMHIEKLEAENAALKEENERLKESARLQKLNNENVYKEIDLVQMENRALKERVAELEEGIARCRQHASYCIGNEDALKNQLSKVRHIANDLLAAHRKQGGEK